MIALTEFNRLLDAYVLAREAMHDVTTTEEAAEVLTAAAIARRELTDAVFGVAE